MHASDAPLLTSLMAQLEQGTGGAVDRAVFERLGIEATDDDALLARRLVERIATLSLSQLLEARRESNAPKVAETDLAPPLTGERGSHDALERFTLVPEKTGAYIGHLADARTLLGLVRAGSLFQRRRALARLRQLLANSAFSGPTERLVISEIDSLRDLELVSELDAMREGELRGGSERGRFAEATRFSSLVEQIDGAVLRFWDGALDVEPFSSIPGDQRVQLLVRARALPERVIAHLGAVLEGFDGVSDDHHRMLLLSSLQFAGDPRLLASLLRLLASQKVELRIEAIRNLSRIEDSRSHAAIIQAYERCIVDHERVLLAGALGYFGDLRGQHYVREALRNEDSGLRLAALEAIANVGNADDTESLVAVARGRDVTHALAAVRALGHIGHAKALVALAHLQSRGPEMLAELEAAQLAIRARLDLMGEEAPADEAALRASRLASVAALAAKRDPALVRLLSWRDYLLGHLYVVIRARHRALQCFEAAAARRPTWIAPLLALAMLHVGRAQYGQALPAFRRALLIDRSTVELQPWFINALLRAFLRRAEDMTREHRHDIARALVEEVSRLDLRRASSSLNFELKRRLGELNEESSG